MKFKPAFIPISMTIFLAIIVLALLMFWSNSSDKSLTDTVPSKEITIPQVTIHNTTADCWVAIGGSVYKLDGYFDKNPDEALSAQLCGKIEPEVVLPTKLKKSALLAYRLGILAP